MDNRLSQSHPSNIKVVCRFRPFIPRELQFRAEPIFRMNNAQQLILKDSKDASFMFDQVFDMDTTQESIYEHVGLPILTNILDGFNGTILAYGQTSSGKTHTMQGCDLNDKETKGLIPRIIENLFDEIEKSPESIQFKLKVSIFELYMEKIRDLLDISKTDLKIRENKKGSYVENLTEAYISEKIQLYKLLHIGFKNRITCVTNMNEYSSRSHMIFLLTLNQFNSETSQSKTSKLFLIDLAGSQKVSKTGAEGKALQQAKKINLSLTSLGKVIKSLSEKIGHIPYRDSKLTRILRDSLGGNSKTSLIVTCSPHEMHLHQTLSTLRFGESAQRIKNKPKINRELTVAQLQKMLEKLEAELEYKDYKINLLEGYIRNTLNSDLPKIPTKLPSKIKDESLSFVSEVGQLHSHHMPSNFYDDEDESSFILKDDLLIQSMELPSSKPSTITNKSNNISLANYEEQISTLESELATYKANLHTQSSKYYQLKKEYNNLNENLKEVVEENIAFQERITLDDTEQKKFKKELDQKYRKNCNLLFGEIESLARSEGSCSRCYEKIKEVIKSRGDFLSLSQEKNHIDCYDYWKTEKEILDKKMEQAIHSQNFLDPKKLIMQGSKTVSKVSDEFSNEKNEILEKKIKGLEKDYQEIAKQRSSWRIQCQIYERKLKMKEEKVAELKGMLNDISEQMQLMTEQYDETMSVNTRIVKPLKGGFVLK